MTAFQKEIAASERLNTQVPGVSPDEVSTHPRFAESLNLTFPLVADPGGRMRERYGQGRLAFFIDLRRTARLVVEGRPENQKVLQRIEELLR